MSSFRPSLTLIRGLSGTGKTNRAWALARERARPRLFSADDFFMVGDEYRFDPTLIPQAHAACISGALAALDGHSVIVHNTFAQRWEMEPYLAAAAERNIPVTVIDLFDAGRTDAELAARNNHGVPEASIAAMRSRWEINWWEADRCPPWDRSF
jgi:predicted kinase